MKIPTLEKCCCGISLKLGTLLIGIFFLVGSIGSFASALDFYYDVEDVINNPESDDPHFVKIRNHLVAAQVYAYSCFVDTALGTILAAILLVGYCNSNQTLLRAWVVGILILQVIEVGSNLSICFVFDHCLYMLYNLAVLFNVYFACIVNSYAQEIIKGSSSSIA